MKKLAATKLAVALFAIAIPFGSLACAGDDAAGGHPGQGVVQELDRQERQVTLDHGDIPGLMKGMTMTFELAPEVSLAGIEAGAEVDFRVKEEGGVYTVTELRHSGS